MCVTALSSEILHRPLTLVFQPLRPIEVNLQVYSPYKGALQEGAANVYAADLLVNSYDTSRTAPVDPRLYVRMPGSDSAAGEDTRGRPTRTATVSHHEADRLPPRAVSLCRHSGCRA